MAGAASRQNGKLGGLPKGFKFKKTIDKELARETYKQAVLTQLQPLVRTQVEKALGRFAKVTVVEMTAGGLRQRRVSSEAELLALIDAGTGYRVALADPDNDMSKYVTDQAIGRATTPVEVSGPDGGAIPVKNVVDVHED